MAEKRKSFAELITPYSTIISVFIPLIIVIVTANYNITEYMRKSSDANFRSVVEKLSAKEEEQRLAAAASMGTFIKRGGEHTEDAVNILLNRLYIESDFIVIKVIIGSLGKIKGLEKGEAIGSIINELLVINRSAFSQDYALFTQKENAKKRYDDIERKLLQTESLYKKYKTEADRIMLEGLKKELEVARENYNKLEMKDFAANKQAVANGIFDLLEKEQYKSLSLVFKQNSFNKIVITDINLAKSLIKRSAFSTSTIQNTIFNEAAILDTFFTFSDLTKSSFKDCMITTSLFDQATLKNVNFSNSEFKDVFFAGSDLTEADFRGVKGLKPEYFYEGKNIDKAKFDDKFKMELNKKLPKIAEDDFEKYVDNSELSKTGKDGLILTIKELKEKKGKYK
jgi:hypothetical protein